MSQRPWSLPIRTSGRRFAHLVDQRCRALADRRDLALPIQMSSPAATHGQSNDERSDNALPFPGEPLGHLLASPAARTASPTTADERRPRVAPASTSSRTAPPTPTSSTRPAPSAPPPPGPGRRRLLHQRRSDSGARLSRSRRLPHRIRRFRRLPAAPRRHPPIPTGHRGGSVRNRESR